MLYEVDTLRLRCTGQYRAIPVWPEPVGINAQFGQRCLGLWGSVDHQLARLASPGGEQSGASVTRLITTDLKIAVPA